MLEGGHDRWRAFLLHYDHAKSPSELTRRQTSVPSARPQEANTELVEQSAPEYSNSQQADMTVAIRDACSRKRRKCQVPHASRYSDTRICGIFGTVLQEVVRTLCIFGAFLRPAD